MKALRIALVAGVGSAFFQVIPAAQAGGFEEKVLYSFCSQQNCTDGAGPSAGLLNANGSLYGTTQDGGSYDTRCVSGCGMAFSVDPKTGGETLLHAFCSEHNCLDGAWPNAPLIFANGVLYGTTEVGVSSLTNCAYIPGCGTVFSIDPHTGAEKVIYSFCSRTNCADGVGPNGVISVNSLLY